MSMEPIAELKRLEDERNRACYYRRWGPYLSERQWGSVREDYSKNGDAWTYFPFEMAHKRAYRWGEDGLLGISDNKMRLCFAFSFWNGQDPILKERLFGLSGADGNHGEDVKEYYYFLDNLPTHSYMRFLYKYPFDRFPYETLKEECRKRTKQMSEYELCDTGIFEKDRYFDCFFEYGKEDDKTIHIKAEIVNRSSEKRELTILPQAWFRNTWSWNGMDTVPSIQKIDGKTLKLDHPTLGTKFLQIDRAEEVLFTENETNNEALFGSKNATPYVKDAFHRYVIEGEKEAVNPKGEGTKAAFMTSVSIEPKQSFTLYLILSDDKREVTSQDVEKILSERKKELEEYYAFILPESASSDHKLISKQAIAGLLSSKQYYHYIVETWLKGDRLTPKPPDGRGEIRNGDWIHLYSEDVLSMPDTWEYPWFASWDLSFHCVVMAMIDPDFAKKQLVLFTREWYMHPNGQIPAYEWNFNDINPPVHAWGAFRVYQIEQRIYGKGDRLFLERVFQKLLLNFTWWVNREDVHGRNIFKGGFLGLDNISVFNRSAPLPDGERLDQSDATSWMAMFCLNMLEISLELAKENPAYEDIASKFFEHFLYIADAMADTGNVHLSLWDDEDGFFYDRLTHKDGTQNTLKVRSLVGLIPLFAVATIDFEDYARFKGFKKRVEWFVEHRKDLCKNVASLRLPGVNNRRLLSIVNKDKLTKILQKMLDEEEFLSPFGIRSVSKYHKDNPFSIRLCGEEYRVDYEPAESTTNLFGGNSNWRGPVWFPVNFLLIESLQKFHHYYGDEHLFEFPKGSKKMCTLWEISMELTKRLIKIFEQEGNSRPRTAPHLFREDPHFKDYLFFNEYFHGDTGFGLGANHQTGWTALVTKLIDQYNRFKKP